ncbi:hypothetical protein D3C76_769670 [compost metagenome]
MPGLVGGDQQHLEGIRRPSGVVQVLHQDRLRPARQQAARHLHAVLQGFRGALAEAVQFELVGAHVVGHRGGFVEEELADFRDDDAALFRMAHHRVAEVDRARIGLADARHHLEDRPALRRAAEIAGEHGVAVAQLADRGDAVHQCGNLLRGQHLAGPVTILSVIGELHGIQRPDVHADAAHGKFGGAVAGVAEHDVGLDGEDVRGTRHDCFLLQNAAVWDAKGAL